MTAYKTNVALQLRIKRLDIYQGSFIWLPILSSLAATITLGRAGVRRPGLGWVGAGQTQWGEPLTACGRIIL